MRQPLSRREFTTGAAVAFASIAVIRSSGRAVAAPPQFRYKSAHDAPLDHPLHVRTVELWSAVRRETNGRLDVQVFGNNQLGNDTAMLSQVRSGAIQFMAIQGVNLSPVVPLTGMDGIGFAFKTVKDAAAAFDGALGDYIRKDVATKGLYAFPKLFDLGFRQITSGTKPVRNDADLANFKIRTPPGRISVDLFRTLGASPTPINIAELYTALQTHIVDGQETPYLVIQTSRFYEVQKYLSVSNHQWTGFWYIANADAYHALPPDIRGIVERNAAKYIDLERHDVAVLSAATADKLRREGLTFTTVDSSSMRAKLGPYYAHWKGEFGDQAWALLERYTGKLS